MNEKDLNSLHIKIDRLEKLVYDLVKVIKINNGYTQGISSQVPKHREELNYLFNYLLNQPTSECFEVIE